MKVVLGPLWSNSGRGPTSDPNTPATDSRAAASRTGKAPGRTQRRRVRSAGRRAVHPCGAAALGCWGPGPLQAALLGRCCGRRLINAATSPSVGLLKKSSMLSKALLSSPLLSSPLPLSSSSGHISSLSHSLLTSPFPSVPCVFCEMGSKASLRAGALYPGSSCSGVRR